MRKIIPVIIILLLLINSQLHAVKAYPHPITVTQPDGSTLVIRMGGDEHFKYQTTEDGILIKMDSNGFYKYAAIENKSIVVKNLIAKNKNERSIADIQLIESLQTAKLTESLTSIQKSKNRQKAASSLQSTLENNFPTKGSVRSLIILVNFSDKSFVTPTTQKSFTDLLNQPAYAQNGGTGSARDYFMASSMGQFTPQFDVVGPYTLPNTLDFYGKNAANGDDENPRQMVIDACTLADAAGVDFRQYDVNNNGFVDNIFIYYAGYNEAEGAAKNTVWPHRWSLSNYSTKFDGKTIFDYACTSELRGSIGSNMCGIGTFSHEFGHVLGLVDYYSEKTTLENWSIMDQGSYLNQGRTPPLYSSYDRFALNWLTPTQLTDGVNIRLKPLSSSNKAYLITQTDTHNLVGSNPSPKEFFLIENRIKTGFDTYLPASGMLIWHIDYDQTAWANNTPNDYSGNLQTAESHMRVYLQPLVGNSTTPGSAFTTGSFEPTLWNGTVLNKTISNINIDNQDITFKYKGGSSLFLPPLATPATSVTNSSLVANWEESNNAKSYLLTSYYTIAGKSIETENFDKGLDLALSWQTSIANTTNLGSTNGIALLFKLNGESITTEVYPETVIEFSFLVQTLDATSANIKLEAHNGLTWETLENISIPGLTSTIKKFNLNKTSNYKQFRLTNTGSNSNTAIDTFAVTYDLKLNYHIKNKIVNGTTDTLRNLVPDQTYSYLVKAVDDYKNISAFSNKINTKLLTYTDNKVLRIDKYLNGDIYVFPEKLDDMLHIYNTAGELKASIKPQDFKINIKEYLQKNNVYILKSGKRLNKILY